MPAGIAGLSVREIKPTYFSRWLFSLLETELIFPRETNDTFLTEIKLLSLDDSNDLSLTEEKVLINRLSKQTARVEIKETILRDVKDTARVEIKDLALTNAASETLRQNVFTLLRHAAILVILIRHVYIV